MKILFCFVFLLTISITLHSQDCANNLPNDWDFEKETDFSKYEEVIVECINWLYSTPMDSNTLARNKAHKFINEWGKHTPTMLLFPYSRVSDKIFKDLNNKDKAERYGVELFMSYYSGMIKYIIENKSDAGLKNVYKAGIENVINLYMLNHEIIYDSKAVSFYLDLKNNGELEQWIEKRICKKDIKKHKCYLSNCPDKEKYLKQNKPVKFSF